LKYSGLKESERTATRARLGKFKKGELAKEAERQIAGMGWRPKLLQYRRNLDPAGNAIIAGRCEVSVGGIRRALR
jgi:hypothetical protein